MVRKIRINENVITDLRGLDIINEKDVKNELRDVWSFNINLQDCSLKQIDRPRTYAAAKNSNNPILGVVNKVTEYQGWNKPKLVGSKVFGIYGDGIFRNLAYGYDGANAIKTNLAKCDTFYEIIPDNPDSYTSPKDIRSQRTPNKPVELPKSNKTRFMTFDDMDSYDPTVNRGRYTRILSQNHLNKYIKEYNDLCDLFNEFRDRFNNVDIRTASNYSLCAITDGLKQFIDKLGDINRYISYVEKGDSVESELKKKFDIAYNAADSLDKTLIRADA